MARILIAALLLALPALAADDSKARDAIQAVFSQVDSCLAKSDAKCLTALFTEDVTFAGPYESGNLVKGKAAVVQYFEKMMQGKGVQQRRSVEKVRFIGKERAFVDCSVETPAINPEKSGGAKESWHSVALMKLENGNWLIEDIRFYVVETRPRAQTPSITMPPTLGVIKNPTPGPAKDGGAPAAPAEPVTPTKS